MEKQIERRITLQPYMPITYLNLTNFPIGNLRNPGIGTKIFDVMLPLYGQEKFEVKKQEDVVPGSFEETNQKNHLKQEGFGANNNTNTSVEEELNSSNKIKKLGDVFSAMQNASINTSTVQFKAKKKVIQSKTKPLSKQSKKTHQFTFL